MVESSPSTQVVLVNSVRIMLEARSNMDSYGDWVANLKQSFLQSCLSVSNILPPSGLCHGLAGIELALLVPGMIWIILFSLLSFLNSIPGRSHHTSLTGSRSTIKHLLFTHGYEVPGLLHPCSFQSSSSRECPAASTLSLILHWSHQSSVPVVQGGRGSHILKILQNNVRVMGGRNESKSPLIELFLCPVRVFH